MPAISASPFYGVVRAITYLFGSPAGDHDPLFRLGKTDVWFRSYVVPADTLMQYKLAPDVPRIEGSARDQRRAILVSAQADPLNPQTFGDQKADRWNRYSLLDLSPVRYCSAQATAQPLAHGSLTRHAFTSKILGNAREVMIYQPRGTQPARWTLILFDGQIYRDEYHFANVLDGLIGRHHVPPINVVFIDSLDHARRGKELPPNPDYADFMGQELLPWLRGQGIAMQRQKRFWQVQATAVLRRRG